MKASTNAGAFAFMMDITVEVAPKQFKVSKKKSPTRSNVDSWSFILLPLRSTGYWRSHREAVFISALSEWLHKMHVNN